MRVAASSLLRSWLLPAAHCERAACDTQQKHNHDISSCSVIRSLAWWTNALQRAVSQVSVTSTHTCELRHASVAAWQRPLQALIATASSHTLCAHRADRTKRSTMFSVDEEQAAQWQKGKEARGDW